MAFQGEQIYHTDQNLANNFAQFEPEGRYNVLVPNSEAIQQFKKFISEYTSQNSFVYRNQLIDNAVSGRFHLKVALEDLNSYSPNLCSSLRSRPMEYYPNFEKAAKEFFCQLQGIKEDNFPEFQIELFSQENPKPLREIKSNLLQKMVTVQGIIVSAAKPFVRAKRLVIKCSKCANNKIMELPIGQAEIFFPKYCNTAQGDQRCPADPFYVVSEKSTMMDQQILKLQENPEDIPTGEIPRTFKLIVDRNLCNRVSPGTRVTLSGIYLIVEGQSRKNKAEDLKQPYIQVLGITVTDNHSKVLQSFYHEEQEEVFRSMAKDPNFYEQIAKSIAPAIYGNEDIKKAILCLLFGGSRKLLSDKMRLRGDINVLLIGDPSTAKSQFLKFVERVAPISIYTSGKGSSASGLTASVNRDISTGEFQIEGGAMVLADGGVVCIDEFDKMKPEDRVAIHEAMEQQTISVAKAGLTTKLNSRTSVLAAANPIFGSYTDSKQIEDQIELQTTILSRFDCIFIVRDLKNAENDKRMAEHILDLHTGKMQMEHEIEQIGENKELFNIETLKQYIAFAKANVYPRLTERSAEKIKNLYVDDRQTSIENQKQKKNHIPITVRQLEAIIRLSEAIAKINLQEEVQEHHIDEAHRLFVKSTMNAIQSGKEIGMEIPQDQIANIIKIEDTIKRRVAIGSRTDFSKLKEEILEKFSNSQAAFDYAILNLIKTEVFQQIEGKKVLLRKK